MHLPGEADFQLQNNSEIRHAYKGGIKGHDVPGRITTLNVLERRKGRQSFTFKQAGAQDLRKRCLIQAHHMVLRNHMVLSVATCYNLLLNLKNNNNNNNFVLSLSRKEIIHLPILLLDRKTAQAYDDNYVFLYVII